MRRIRGRHFTKARSAATLPPLELDIQSRIRAALDRIGCHVTNLSQTRRSTVTPGTPDLYVSHAAWGIRAWVETKTEDGRLSEAQRKWHAAERAAGGTVLVATSAADALEQFAALPRRRT